MSKRETEGDEAKGQTVLHGIGVSPGVVVGPVFLLLSEDDQFVQRVVAKEEVALEIGRLEQALIRTRTQIKEIQRNVEPQMGRGNASILDAHLMVLDDRAFIEEVVHEITAQLWSAETALRTVASRYIEALSGAQDDYLRERVVDLRDVTRRIVRNAAGGEDAWSLLGMESRSIVVTPDLAPSQTATLPRDVVLGFATDLGSPTSHTAVMAKAMEIPAVVGMHDVTSKVVTGDKVLMDGNKGILIVNPTAATLSQYGKVVAERRHIVSGLTTLKDRPAVTKDGRRVVLAANIEKPADVASVLAHGAEGVGLFRSEYVYLSGDGQPTEAELAEDYSKVTEGLAPATVVIRTLDLGGDKVASFMNVPPEINPFLGCRSIRFLLKEPELFKTQLRAILRASSRHNTKVMYPMISSAEEVVQANALLEEAKKELRAQAVVFDEGIEVGAMIETPCAALTADLIARHVKFMSLGTNDLIQYTIAVDRGNERVAYLYQPTHPAILKLIRMTIDVGHRHGIWVGVCGEMGADPLICPLLVGMGVDEISVTPASVPIIKDVVRSITYEDARKLAEQAMAMESASEVLAQCRELIRRVAPEILELTA